MAVITNQRQDHSLAEKKEDPGVRQDLVRVAKPPIYLSK